MSNIQIREIRENDAEKFLSLCKQLDHETSFMMLEPDERTTTIEEQKDRIRDILGQNNSTILVAEMDEELVGYVGAYGGSFNRCRHSAYIVTGVLASYHGKGIGTLLFSHLEKWAKVNDIHRLELTVMVHNQKGIALYKKFGFEIEGTKRHSLRVNGEYVDEYYMSKLIE
jgi:RimJ/RimL family protein N-acetyltransferase